MESQEETIIEDLRESYNRFGPLRRVVVTQFGIAAGETRKKAVPEWPEVHKEVKDKLEHLKLKAIDNIQAVKPASWWTALLTEAAKEYEKAGIPKEEIASKMVEDFPLSKSKILRYLPDKYKQKEKVEVGKMGGRPSKEIQPTKESVLVSRETKTIVEQYTPTQALIESLEQMKIPYKAEQRFMLDLWRCPKCRKEYDEDALPIVDKTTKEFYCRNDGGILEQEVLKCDIVIETPYGFSVALQIGPHSSEKEKLLKGKIRAWHIPDKMAHEWASQIAEGIKVLLK